MTAEKDLLAAERRLQKAQLAGDVEALDTLLDDRLLAVGPDGSTFTKADDLEIHVARARGSFRTGGGVLGTPVSRVGVRSPRDGGAASSGG
jgi:hypothetical protein